MFRLQKEQNKFHENQHNEMTEILKTPLENQCFAKILPALQNLQESFTNLQKH